MTAEDVLQQIQPWRERWQRTAWKPQTVDGDAAITASKFAGTPWLAAGEAWPVCQACGEAMPLLVQLNLEHLPPELKNTFGSGLLQLFYCTTCYDDRYLPFSPSNLARIVQTNGESVAVTPPLNSFPPKAITHWHAFADFPHPQDHGRLGVDYDYDFGEHLRTTVTSTDPPFSVSVIDDEYLAERIGLAEVGDKLAGWPHWVQGSEYPTCPRCEQQMRLVFQLDSDDHLPLMFGDAGIGHITQCPTHLDVVAFGWACS